MIELLGYSTAFDKPRGRSGIVRLPFHAEFEEVPSAETLRTLFNIPSDLKADPVYTYRGAPPPVIPIARIEDEAAE
jgi:hypothetical protein